MKKQLVLAISASLAASSMAHASELDNLKVNGFATGGGIYTDSDHGRDHGVKGNIEDGTSFQEDTRAGVQLDYEVNEDFNLALQGLVDSVNDSYRGSVSWAYGSYDVAEGTTVRAGRLRTPLYLKSDTLDVGYTYPWIRVPGEVYSQVPMRSYDGMDVLQDFSVGGYDFSAQAFAGTVNETEINLVNDTGDLETDLVAGFNADFPVPYGSVRVAYGHANNSSIEETGGIESSESIMAYNGQIPDFDGDFYSVGAELTPGKSTILAEITNTKIEGASVPAWYATYGYNVTPSLMPHITYSAMKDAGLNGDQHSITAGARYDLMPGVSLKGEIKHTQTEDYHGQFANGFGEQTLLSQVPDAYYDQPGAPSEDTDATSVSFAVDYVF